MSKLSRFLKRYDCGSSSQKEKLNKKKKKNPEPKNQKVVLTDQEGAILQQVMQGAGPAISQVIELPDSVQTIQDLRNFDTKFFQDNPTIKSFVRKKLPIENQNDNDANFSMVQVIQLRPNLRIKRSCDITTIKNQHPDPILQNKPADSPPTDPNALIYRKQPTTQPPNRSN